MIKKAAVLFVCGATLTACAHPEPAQNAQANTGTPTSGYQGYTGTTAGATEQMPEPVSTSTAAPASAPRESAPRAIAPSTSPAAGGQATGSSAQTTEPWTDGRILEVIHSVDQGEIAQAQLASTRATDARVKRFAAMMINDHRVADDEAQTTARRSGTGYEVSTTSRNLETDVRTSTEGLKGQTGVEFDRAYIGTQIAEHQAMLGTIDDDLMPHAQSAEVKKLLTKVRGKVLSHLEHAQGIFAALNK